jgi:hypothetical protein
MKNNRKKKTKPTPAVQKSGCTHEVSGPSTDEPAFSRWAQFEAQVLSKVKNPRGCMKVIAQRQEQVDDDTNEADLVAAYIRKILVDATHDPDTCCVFFTTAEITPWIQEATGMKGLPTNKTTAYLRRLGIRELRYSKKDGAPGWVWSGRAMKVGQTAKAFSPLKSIPKRWSAWHTS